jgi:hypothetical protein
MSMRHYYDFFDRAFFDPVWRLSWREFQRQHGSRWAANLNYEPGEYSGRSLRELICFSMDPVLSPERLEDILARRTVQWTVRHSGSQYFFLSELMRKVSGYRANLCSAFDFRDISVVISAAVGGYLAGRLPSSDLLAVLKLHGCADPGEWVKLPAGQRKKLVALTSGVDFLKPTYAWQGKDACLDTEWTNCLGLRDTQRFLAFIARAWRENWPLLELDDQSPMEPLRDKEPRFRNLPIARDLKKAQAKASRFKRPNVFRQCE